MMRLAGRVRVLRDSPVSKSCSLVALASTILSTMSRGYSDIVRLILASREIKALFYSTSGKMELIVKAVIAFRDGRIV